MGKTNNGNVKAINEKSESENRSTFVQGIRVTFSNGRVGDFFGKAIVMGDELDSVRITNVELGYPEKFEHHIKESLLSKSGSQE